MFVFLTLALICVFAQPLNAVEGKVKKVLPFFLDLKGRHTLHPSLYERDAYQAFLRQNPEMRSGMVFHVQWRASGTIRAPLRLRLELRGVAEGNLPHEILVEKTVRARGWGWFGQSSDLLLSGDDYAQLREVTAWRVTLWEGDDLLLGRQQSFLW